MEIIYETKKGKIVHADNLEVLKKMKKNWADSCISDFPYDLSFMGKKWDTTGNFYQWCFDRAQLLFEVIKPGGYACIFGHSKTNHRMKCAFEDVGFNIVDEIEWIYGTGMPKNQDIGKSFDKKAGIKRETEYIPNNKNNTYGKGMGGGVWNAYNEPAVTEQAKKWNGWKTAGLKPAHEPITIFQKPLEGTYIENIEKWNCAGMNIDACRISISQEDKDMINAKVSKNPTTNYSDSNNRIYGKFAEDKAMPANELGRFPANIIIDQNVAQAIDDQSGETQSGKGNGNAKSGEVSKGVTPLRRGKLISRNDTGGASRYFLNIEQNEFEPFIYCAKPTKKERGQTNTHVTVKPKALIKWLIKLVTPKNGRTIDITAGSGTHGVACEELNKDENYNLTWLNIESSNTEKEPYCNIAMERIKNIQ